MPGALVAYESSLTIAERLAKQDPRDTDLQRELYISRNMVGDVRHAQGDRAGALAAYEASLAIAERLAKQDPANSGWQRDLSVSHQRIGNVRKDQGDLPAALVAYDARLAIAERLAKQDPTNAQWQGDLAASYINRGDILREQGDITVALRAFDAATEIARRLNAKEQDKASRGLLAEVIGDRSFTLLFDRQFKAAITAAEEAQGFDPEQLWLTKIQAHGYLLSGQFTKAQAIYREHAADQLAGQRTLAQAALEDFAAFRKHGIDHPDMKRIEALLKAGEKPAAPVGKPKAPAGAAPSRDGTRR